MAATKNTVIRLLYPVQFRPNEEPKPIGAVLSESEDLPKKEMARLVKEGFAEYAKAPAVEAE